jgi:hypothetical protein
MTETRAADSLTGPCVHLDDYVEHAQQVIWGGEHAPAPLYDRHPLISELIYGPTLRGSLDTHERSKFNDPQWLRDQLEFIQEETMVIFCLPPLDNVLKNLASTPNGHMPGVQENATRLYWLYHATAAAWGGPCYLYDYTYRDSKLTVVNIIKGRVKGMNNAG